MPLEIAILGSVEPRMNGAVVDLPAGKQKALLSLLAISAPHPVSADTAAEALWPRSSQAEAIRSLQVTISRLRRSLATAGPAVHTVAAGYRLAIDSDAIDARRFEFLIAEARSAREAGDAGMALRLLDDALSLWRGPALADVAFESFAQPEIARLEELRLSAHEERIDARMSRGDHALVVAELEQLVAEHPSRERLVTQLMLALYRCGRQSDALEVYTRGRVRLDEELGLDPSPELRRLQQAILSHDPSLSPPSTDGREMSAPRKRALPLAPNRTIGRERELAALRERLLDRSVRLLTLTGPGGIGKTRLALEAARAVEERFAEGASFVSLAALRRYEDVPAEIVNALAIIVLEGESPEQAAERFLATKQLLLVIDNFEHVLEAAPFVAGLLGACPALTVLATSREALALQAEECYPVEALDAADAVTLFGERARAHDPGFDRGAGTAAAVSEICGRVDGLPLAIELAAARCGLLSPSEIAERLEAVLGTAGAGARDAPARQQTLRATIEWSHDLLGDREKACFARFAVFAGGATVEATEVITGAGLDTLDRLVAKALLVRRRQPDTATRLLMLETIRAYAREQLALTVDEDVVRERHYRYFLELARRHGSEQAVQSAEGARHLARLDGENDNLHEALRWAVDVGDAEQALALCAALGCYWWMRNRFAIAVRWIDRVLSMPGADAHPALRVELLCDKVWCLRWLEHSGDQHAVMSELEAVARGTGDPLVLARALQTCGNRETTSGRPDLGSVIAEEALRCAIAAGDDWEIANAASAKAMAASTVAELRDRVEDATSLLDEVGNTYQLADLLSSGAYTALCLGGDQLATELVERATPLAQTLEDPYLWMMLRGNAGLAALVSGDTDAADVAFRDELTLSRELVVRPIASEGFLGLAAVAAVRGDAVRAARLFGAASAHAYGEEQKQIRHRLDAAFLDAARGRCGPDAWDAAVGEGAALGFDDAIDYALDAARRRRGATSAAQAAMTITDKPA